MMSTENRAMSEVHVDPDEVRALAAGWPQIVPPSLPHPLPPAGSNPVSAAFAAAVADWPAIHADMCAHREELADKYVADLHGNAAVLDSGDQQNAVVIDGSGEL
jgi:hypothetical protein